jgi:hypothetical protein
VAYEAYRANGRMKNGRRFGSPPKPYAPPDLLTGRINITGPDSRTLKTPRGSLQGHNAQAVCTEQQIVVAAEVSVSSADFGQMGPMIDNARVELAAAGVTEGPGGRVGRRGYWHASRSTGSWARAGADPALADRPTALLEGDGDRFRGVRETRGARDLLLAVADGRGVTLGPPDGAGGRRGRHDRKQARAAAPAVDAGHRDRLARNPRHS